MRVFASESLCMLIDIQERLMPVMHEGEKMLDHTRVLIEGLKILEIPFLISEQYPKGLGPTLSFISQLFPETPALPKISFSCCDDETIMAALRESDRANVLVAGVEAHVCVQQTVVDLFAMGFQPVVVADCITSRDPADRDRAIDRMRAEGAIITGAESLLFELCRYAGTDQFKAISALVK